MLFVCVHMCNTGGAVYMCLHVACCMREWANPKNPELWSLLWFPALHCEVLPSPHPQSWQRVCLYFANLTSQGGQSRAGVSPLEFWGENIGALLACEVLEFCQPSSVDVVAFCRA